MIKSLPLDKRSGKPFFSTNFQISNKTILFFLNTPIDMKYGRDYLGQFSCNETGIPEGKIVFLSLPFISIR